MGERERNFDVRALLRTCLRTVVIFTLSLQGEKVGVAQRYSRLVMHTVVTSVGFHYLTICTH